MTTLLTTLQQHGKRFLAWLHGLVRRPAPPAAPTAQRPKKARKEKADPGCEWTPGFDDLDALQSKANEALDFMVARKQLHPDHRAPGFVRDQRWLTSRGELTDLMVVGPALIHEDSVVAKGRVDGTGLIDTRVGIPAISCCYLGASGGRTIPLMVGVERLADFPPQILPGGEGWPFVVRIIEKTARGVLARNNYITISSAGKISDAYFYYRTASTFRGRGGFVTVPNVVPHMAGMTSTILKNRDGSETDLETIIPWVNTTIRWWQNENFHWRVTLSDDRGTVRACATPGFLRNLLKERERDDKRRIHWVASHLRNGATPVRTHLRGATVFTWRGFRVGVYVPGDVKAAPTRGLKQHLDQVFGTDAFVHEISWNGNRRPLWDKMVRQTVRLYAGGGEFSELTVVPDGEVDERTNYYGMRGALSPIEHARPRP